jgi:hypothetical protein
MNGGGAEEFQSLLIRQLRQFDAEYAPEILIERDLIFGRDLGLGGDEMTGDLEGYSRALFVISTLPGTTACLHEGWPVSRKDVVTTQHH